jgi:hypothetical protein
VVGAPTHVEVDAGEAEEGVAAERDSGEHVAGISPVVP